MSLKKSWRLGSRPLAAVLVASISIESQAMKSPMELVESQYPVALYCQSLQKHKGWKGYETRDYVFFSARLHSPSELMEARVSGAYQSEVHGITADLSYSPRAELYRGYNRFLPLKDAWFLYYLLLPKDVLSNEQSDVRAYLQIFDARGFRTTVTMTCQLF